MLDFWYGTGDINTCYVRNLDVRTPHQDIESVNGNATEVVKDVLGIFIEDEVCHFIPQGWSKFFTQVIAFGVRNSQLQRLSKFDLQPFPNIIRFTVYGAQLEVLQADVFTYNTKLVSITINDDNLMNIGSSLLDNLSKLTYADIEIKCFRATCHYSDCLTSFPKHLKRSCQPDPIIAELKAQVQALKNEILICRNSAANELA